jgi:hypothetical protein
MKKKIETFNDNDGIGLEGDAVCAGDYMYTYVYICMYIYIYMYVYIHIDMIYPSYISIHLIHIYSDNC